MRICDWDHLHKRFLDVWEWSMRQGFDTRVLTYVENAFQSEPIAELADRKTEPNAIQHVQHVESVKDETGRWVRVGQWEWEHHTDSTHFGKAKGESVTTNEVEDEPRTERSE